MSTGLREDDFAAPADAPVVAACPEPRPTALAPSAALDKNFRRETGEREFMGLGQIDLPRVARVKRIVPSYVVALRRCQPAKTPGVIWSPRHAPRLSLFATSPRQSPVPAFVGLVRPSRSGTRQK